jgi:hypothetical protein
MQTSYFGEKSKITNFAKTNLNLLRALCVLQYL